MAKAATRSPLREKPLRGAGQSVQDEIDRVADEGIDHLVLILIVFTLWATALLTLLLQTPPATLFGAASTFLVGVLAWSVPKIVHKRAKLLRLKQGRDGERAVAEYLDLLRGGGYRVFHDLIADGFNIDHIIVGPQGIYTIETKTYSKPVEGDHRVFFDGEIVKVGTHIPSDKPVNQARAQAAWLKQAIADMTGRNYPVRPVIVFPGWFVERTHRERPSDVWVLAPKALSGFLEKEPVVLAAESIALIANRLKVLMRGSRP